MFGSVPQSVVDDEEDFIGHLHSAVSDLVGDCRVAACTLVDSCTCDLASKLFSQHDALCYIV